MCQPKRPSQQPPNTSENLVLSEHCWVMPQFVLWNWPELVSPSRSGAAEASMHSVSTPDHFLLGGGAALLLILQYVAQAGFELRFLGLHVPSAGTTDICDQAGPHPKFNYLIHKRHTQHLKNRQRR